MKILSRPKLSSSAYIIQTYKDQLLLSNLQQCQEWLQKMLEQALNTF